MTSKITPVKLGDIAAKIQWGQKAEGSIQGVLRKKTHQPELHLDQNYLLKDKRQNKDPLRSITTEKNVSVANCLTGITGGVLQLEH